MWSKQVQKKKQYIYIFKHVKKMLKNMNEYSD